jgi:DNA polymerase-3 subunit epsilon
MKEHILEKDGDGYRCSVCRWPYKKPPRSYCPGYPRYEWHQAPENLLTKNQLTKQKLNPGEPRGIVGEWLLYDIAEATPYTDEQLAARREKARQSRLRRVQIVERHAALLLEFERSQQERRDKAILWARKLVEEGSALILDTETTGLDADDEVIQIAIIDIRGETVLYSLVNPCFPIPEEATQINGITDEMVANAPNFDEIHKRLIELLPGHELIAYNAEFDERMLIQSAVQWGNSPKDFFRIKHDAMLYYADFVGEWSEYYESNKWQPLPGGDHTALGDCKATLGLIRGMAGESSEITNQEEREK